MRITIASLIGLLVSTSLAGAQPATSPPPVFKIVDSTDKAKGLIVFRETDVRLVQEQRVIVEVINGMQVQKVVMVSVPVLTERLTQISVADSRLMTADGKQLPIDEVWKRAKAKSVVLVSSDGSAPAQVFLSVLNADTIVIVPPLRKQMPVPAPKVEGVPAPKKT